MAIGSAHLILANKSLRLPPPTGFGGGAGAFGAGRLSKGAAIEGGAGAPGLTVKGGGTGIEELGSWSEGG